MKVSIDKLKNASSRYNTEVINEIDNIINDINAIEFPEGNKYKPTSDLNNMVRSLNKVKDGTNQIIKMVGLNIKNVNLLNNIPDAASNVFKKMFDKKKDSVPDADPLKNKITQIYDYYIDKGYSSEMAEWMVINMINENSKLDTQYDENGHYGLFQLSRIDSDGNLAKEYFDNCLLNNLDPGDWKNQCDFFEGVIDKKLRSISDDPTIVDRTKHPSNDEELRKARINITKYSIGAPDPVDNNGVTRSITDVRLSEDNELSNIVRDALRDRDKYPRDNIVKEEPIAQETPVETLDVKEPIKENNYAQDESAITELVKARIRGGKLTEEEQRLSNEFKAKYGEDEFNRFLQEQVDKNFNRGTTFAEGDKSVRIYYD